MNKKLERFSRAAPAGTYSEPTEVEKQKTKTELRTVKKRFLELYNQNKDVEIVKQDQLAFRVD